MIIIRELRSGDWPFVWEMLYVASFPLDEPKPPRQRIHEPIVARYLSGWGRRGDRALIAECCDRRVGAAWYRLFPRSDPGFGFVDEMTPELSIAVVGAARRHGVGRSLLERLLECGRDDGVPALSLSVARANTAARRLYERCGFEVVGVDQAEDGITMRVALGGPLERGGMPEIRR